MLPCFGALPAATVVCNTLLDAGLLQTTKSAVSWMWGVGGGGGLVGEV